MTIFFNCNSILNIIFFNFKGGGYGGGGKMGGCGGGKFFTTFLFNQPILKPIFYLRIRWRTRRRWWWQGLRKINGERLNEERNTPYLAKPSKSTFTTVCRLHLLRTQQNHLVFGFNLYLLVPKSITTPHNINTNTHQHRNTKNTFIYTKNENNKCYFSFKVICFCCFF